MSMKKIRLAAGLTQKEVANRMRVDRSTVAKWEAGIYPRGKRLKELTNILNCTVDKLLSKW